MRLFAAAFLLLLSACAPESQLYVPEPEGHARLEDNIFHTADDAALPSRQWLPAQKPKAVIVALHGFNDYSTAFEGAGNFFKKHRVALYAYDQRGFGATQQTGIWSGEDNLTSDLRQYIELLAKRYPRTPMYILGESMGGAVALAALAEPEFPVVKGVILVAPAVWGEETMNPIFRGTLWMAAHTLPTHKLTGSSLKILATNNIPLLRRMVADPLVIKQTRIDAIYGMVQLMDSAYDDVPRIATPVLLLYGAKDQVIPRSPIESAHARFSSPVKSIYYPEGYHMLLRDLEGEVVLRDILRWVENPSAPPPSGYDGLENAAAASGDESIN